MLWLTKQQLKFGNVAARRRLIHALCHKPVADPQVVKVLLDLLNDSDAEVRCVAMTAIGKSDDARRAEAVRRALADSDGSVRNAAILAAKRLKDESLAINLVPILQDADFGLRASAALVLEALGWRPASPAEEIRLLIARGQLQRAAVLGPTAIPALEAILNSGPVGLRPKAVDALGRIDDKTVLKPILAALRSAETAVAVAAVDAIGKIGNPEFADALVPLLKHKEALVRTNAVDALGRLGAARHAEAMVALLKDAHWDTRRTTADALAKLKEPKVVPALAAALADADSDVREACALALGALRDRSAIAALVLALQDSTSSVRRIVAAALARVDEDWSSSPEAQPALEQLKALETSRPTGIRSVSASGLGLRGTGEPVTTAVRSTVPDPEKNHRHAVNLFAGILTDADRDLRQAAVEALARLGGQRAEAALTRALRDADAGVQLAAELSLKQFDRKPSPATTA